ncbi:MAG TPA: alkaline phosphatase [Steroidobacteraceae bacterium]|nr:alkaline phosphatase [Steroidobacteraceae bacterium]
MRIGIISVAAVLLSGLAVAADPGDYQRASASVAARARAGSTSPKRARNVILFIGDGMGISTITAARILEGQRRGESGEQNHLSFEDFPYSALVRTYSANQQTSDSAPTATAMVTGWHANEDTLGVSPELPQGSTDAAMVARFSLPTLLEQAEQRGLATGVVTTTRITHATPAANYAHTPNRDWEYAVPAGATLPDIAAQLIAHQHTGDGIEVVLGGGREDLTPAGMPDPEYPRQSGLRRDGRNLIQEWVSAQPDSAFVWKRDDLLKVDLSRTRHLLGLFEPSHMQFESDRAKDPAGEPSLAEMTTTAIEVLRKNRKGFFLMVEGGRIDHAHHAGNAYRALTDTIAFSDAVHAATRLVDARDTLVLVTADHSHTLTISGYPARGNPILGLVKGAGASAPALDAARKPYTTLSYANGPGFAIIDGSVEAAPRSIAPGREQDLSKVDTTDPDFHQQSLVGMGSETHGGEDVALFARGPGADLARGVIDQNEIYHIMRRALRWKSP